MATNQGTGVVPFTVSSSASLSACRNVDAGGCVAKPEQFPPEQHEIGVVDIAMARIARRPNVANEGTAPSPVARHHQHGGGREMSVPQARRSRRAGRAWRSGAQRRHLDQKELTRGRRRMVGRRLGDGTRAAGLP